MKTKIPKPAKQKKPLGPNDCPKCEQPALITAPSVALNYYVKLCTNCSHKFFVKKEEDVKL